MCRCAAVVADALGRALGLWRGEPLADVEAPFAETQNTRLTELRLSAVEARADAGLACGRQDELVAELEGVGSAVSAAGAVVGAADHRAGPLAAVRRMRWPPTSGYALLLHDELGADPGEQLQRAHRDVLARPRTAAVRLPPGAAVPAPHSALVGREYRHRRILALLTRPGVRLVTVLGPGGVGKTRQ